MTVYKIRHKDTGEFIKIGGQDEFRSATAAYLEIIKMHLPHEAEEKLEVVQATGGGDDQDN